MTMDPLTVTATIITLGETLQQVLTLLGGFANADKKVAEIRRDLRLTESVVQYLHEQESKQRHPPSLSIDGDSPRSVRRSSKAGVHLSDVLRDTISQLKLELQCFATELSNLTEPCSPGSKVGKIVANGKVAWKMPYLEAMQRKIVNKRMQLELIRNSLEMEVTYRILWWLATDNLPSDRNHGRVLPTEPRKSANTVPSIFHAPARQLDGNISDTSLPPPSYHAQETFVKAVRKGKWRDVESLLKQVHPNFRLGPKDGEVFPLHISAMLGDLVITELLISYGATVDCCTQNNETPLMMAIEYDKSVVALALIRRGADVNRSDARGQTPLHVAARKNSKAVVQTLLNNGADPNAYDDVGRTPLMEAICRDDREIQPNDTSVLRVLLAPNGSSVPADPTLATTRKHYTPLHHAAAQGWLDDLRLLTTRSRSGRAQACAVLDSFDRTPLWFAAQQNHLAVMEYLVGSGIDPNQRCGDKENPTALWAASNDDAAVEFLLRSGSDPNHVNNEGHTLLHRACWSGNAILARLVMTHGADPTIRDRHGMQPLHYVAREGYESLVKLLLESSELHNIDVNCVDNNGTTPLMFAADQGHDFMVKLLVSHSPPADFRHKDNLGCDAFYFACARGHIICASYLLGCGADINTGNRKQNTALHVVAKLGKKDMVGWLLRMGADPQAKSIQPFDGMDVKGTPLEIVKAAGLSPSTRDDIVQMLESWEPDRRKEMRYTVSTVPS